MKRPSSAFVHALALAGLTPGLIASPACASFGTHANTPSSLGFGSANAQMGPSLPSADTLALMGPPTSETERDARIDAASGDKPLNEKAIRGAFWGGVITGSFGGALSLGFGIAGASASNRLADDYAQGVSYADRDQRVSRGETYNALAVTGAALLVTGVAISAITYAIDATRCGPLRQKREGCTPH